MTSTEVQTVRKKSKLGFASFVISVIGGVLVLSAVILVYASPPSEWFPTVYHLIGVGILLLALILDVVGFFLGISGLCRKNAKKGFAVLGMLLSGLSILGILTLIIIERL